MDRQQRGLLDEKEGILSHLTLSAPEGPRQRKQTGHNAPGVIVGGNVAMQAIWRAFLPNPVNLRSHSLMMAHARHRNAWGHPLHEAHQRRLSYLPILSVSSVC